MGGFTSLGKKDEPDLPYGMIQYSSILMKIWIVPPDKTKRMIQVDMV